MDFFARQDQARRHTKRLVVYFVLAVACIIASVYLACILIFGAASARHGSTDFPVWNSNIFFYSAMGSLAVIVFGSLFKISALSAGGSAVAESLGGRLVEPGSANPQERRLLNVVEEMALASGVPTPKVYVMDEESGINAFAAGHTPSDAAVSVTRGTLQTLNRDELQGVIGHEFSHILNGDMRLNLQLMGMIFGILCLATIGRILLNARGGRRDRNPLPLLGLALLAIGGIGVFFGRLIQAAVSRQREFLADASSVQFTRNPAGLSGALQKIGAVGSRMESNHAADACHMFFGNGLSDSFMSAFATHPPLEERIRAIDPNWDGNFPPVPQAALIDDEAVSSLLSRAAHVPPTMPLPFGQAAGLTGTTVRAATVVPNLGKPTPMHLEYAEKLRNSFPENVNAATREPISAVALVYALLLSEEEATRTTQLEGLAKQIPAAIYEKVVALRPEVAPIASRARLPLVNLALPGLRQLRPEDFQAFNRTLKWLIESDEQIEFFEFVLQKIVQRHLAPHFTRGRAPVAQYYTMKPLTADGAVLLSALARVSSAEETEVRKAFQTGLPYLRSPDGTVALLTQDQCGLAQIDTALNRLTLAVPQIKKNIIEACIHVVGADGVIQEREAELLRAIADTLDCPIPPFVDPN